MGDDITNIEYIGYSELFFESSRFKTGNKNRPIFDLTHQIADIKELKVSRLAVPLTYYVFNTNTDTFTVIEDTGSLTVSVTIPNGNYDASTFVSTLKTLLDAESLASGNTLTYTVTDSDITRKITVAATGGFAISVATSSALTGFSAVQTGASTYEATDVYNMVGPKNLYLRSNIANFLSRDSIVENSSTYNNVLTQFPTNGNTGDINYVSYDNTLFLKTQFDLSDIEFYFTDVDGVAVDFQGESFSVTMQIKRDIVSSG